MEHKVTVFGYDSGLNELLDAQYKAYDRRTKRMRVNNSEKQKNDRLCRKWLINYGFAGKKIKTPIFVHYHFFCKDKKHDKTNIAYAFCKSFLDALQELKIIPNDGWQDIENVDFQFDIDKEKPRVEVIISERDQKG